MATKRKYLKSEETYVDTETGEVITSSKTYGIKVATDEFYMTFVGALSGFYSLASAIDIKVLAKMCEASTFNTGEVMLPTAKRKQIAEELNVSVQQVTNALASLKKKGLIDGERGLYMLSADVFWKGSMEARKEFLEGRRLKVVVEFEKE
jgi:hypothetical protein